jgi:murein DD-endopeptidase MepM/ murein hydrolase activator NlpD
LNSDLEASMAKVTSVVDTVMAEAGGKTPAERFRDMKAIASVIANRARMLGVSMQDVVGVQSEFNAFGKKMPAGVESLRAMAEQAVADVVNNGPINNATFYSTPETTDNLPSGLSKEDETAGHHFFSDPAARAIRTVQGYIDPADTAIAASYAPVDRVSAAPSAFDSLFGGYAAAPQTSFSNATGLLSDEAAPTSMSGLLGVERSGFGSPFGQLGDRITSGFGFREAPQTSRGLGSKNHRGVDMSLQGGVGGYPAEAAAGGVVSFAGPSKSYGNMVELSHPDGTKTRYGHLAEIGNLAIGDEVARGTPVGLVGNTGRSKGAHLHFETINSLGQQVDPASVVDFNAASNVPTPVSRPDEAWQNATPMAVERQSLPSVSTGLLATPDQQKAAYGQLASTMSQTPSLGLSGVGVNLGATARMADNADVAQGYAGLRDSLLGQASIGRVADTQMADMQAQANQDRQAMEDRARQTAQMNQGLLSLSPDQMAAAMDRRQNALGVLSAAIPASVASANQPQSLAGQLTNADLTTPTSMPSNVSLAQSLTGVAPTMTQTVNTGLLSSMPDISAPVSSTEFTGFLTNPAVTAAQKIGVQPTAVQSVNPGLLNPSAMAVDAQPTVTGPVTTETISTPQRTTQKAAQRVSQTPATGLLSPAEYSIVAAQQQALSKQGKNKATAFKNAIGPVAGAIVGGLLAGPIGGLIGGFIGNQVTTAPRGTGVNHFPGKPKGGSIGNGQLSDYGRSVAEGSRQFGGAVSNGSVGLW